MDQFYITLPSNSSEKFYGKQPMHRFKTHIAKPFNIDVEDWEVGLAEIIYPHTWHNITDGRVKVMCLEYQKWVWKTTMVPSAYYSTPEELIGMLTSIVSAILDNQKKNILFNYDAIERKFFVDIKSGYRVRFSAQLAIALGLGDCEAILRGHEAREEVINDVRCYYSGNKITGLFTADLNRGLHTFFIYSDIVAHQLVGDANVPLLRVIPVTGKNGDVVVQSFDNIHYAGLSRSTFQEIEIVITDDTGERVPFEKGRVIVKLHFRKE